MLKAHFTLIGLMLVQLLCAQTDELSFEVNGVTETHSIIYKSRDTTNGKVLAVFAADTNQVAIEQYYWNKRANGRFLAYYPNGKYREVTVYANGKREGEWTQYLPSGEIGIKGRYKAGAKHGFWNYRTERCMGRYKNGKRQGNWKYYNENKYVYKIATYKDDELLKEMEK